MISQDFLLLETHLPSTSNMKTIEEHIARDKEILADPTTSEPMKRHMVEELHELEVYEEHHHDEIEAGDLSLIHI